MAQVFILTQTDTSGDSDASGSALGGVWSDKDVALAAMASDAESHANVMDETVTYGPSGYSCEVCDILYQIIIVNNDVPFENKDDQWIFLG